MYVILISPSSLPPSQGEKGDMGDEGKRGPSGQPGTDGDSGENGEPGDKGAKGERGRTGQTVLHGYVHCMYVRVCTYVCAHRYRKKSTLAHMS